MKNQRSKRIFLRFGLILLALYLFLSNSQQWVLAQTPMPPGIGPSVATATPASRQAKVEFYFFYSTTCSHCMAILNDIILPLQAQNPGMIDARLLDINADPNAYQALLKAEEHFQVPAEKRDIPTVLIAEKILIGERENRDALKSLITAGLAAEGISFPIIPGLEAAALPSSSIAATQPAEVCRIDNPDSCAVASPIQAAYFYQLGCKECSRSEADLKYLQSQFPNLVINEFNYYEQTALANWMAERIGRADEMHAPAVFIADQAFIGEAEINPQNMLPLLNELANSGSSAFWIDYDPQAGQNALVDKFNNLGWFAIVFAGFIDGLNPCAFATIVFFVSYLHISGRKGREIILTGTSFTLGVFLAYLVVGLGFFRVLDLVKNTISLAGKIVYALTGAFCLTLGILNLRDYVNIRRGSPADMALKLPEPLRNRINATIRQGSKASRYYISAFLSGVIISVLELACTGQIYLPTIIYMTSVAGLRAKAVPALILYNLLFILPLIVVFMLAYYGTESKVFTRFLKDNAAPVKLGMAFLFIGLSIWLLSSLIV